MMKTMLAVLVSLLAVLPLRAASLEELSARLDSPQPAARLDAVRNMAVEFGPSATAQMLRAARDADELVRERAVQALGTSGAPEAVPVLVESLRDPVWFVRRRSVQALARLGARDIVNELAPLAADPNCLVKESAFELLGDILAGKLRTAGGGDHTVLPDNPARRALVRGLDDTDETARLAAAKALARSGDGAAFEPLTGLLAKGSLFVRNDAALALGILGDKRAIGPLIEAVGDPRNAVEQEGRDWARWGAVKSLVLLTGMDFKADAAAWRAWHEKNSGQ